uniref:Uncharacterized protein n=1 Tax=viral metagenome TaxID=1070528 RepID=A0A6M3JWG4_9ZZZZ
MKFKVFTDSKEKLEQEVYFRLVVMGTGVRLIACDSDGQKLENGNILDIIPDEGIHRMGAVSEEIGLPLGSFGRVELIDD